MVKSRKQIKHRIYKREKVNFNIIFDIQEAPDEMFIAVFA